MSNKALPDSIGLHHKHKQKEIVIKNLGRVDLRKLIVTFSLAIVTPVYASAHLVCTGKQCAKNKSSVNVLLSYNDKGNIMLKRISALLLVSGLLVSSVCAVSEVQPQKESLYVRATKTTGRRAALVGTGLALVGAGVFGNELRKAQADKDKGFTSRLSNAAKATKDLAVNEYTKAKAAFGKDGSLKAKGILAAKVLGAAYLIWEGVQFVRGHNGPAALVYNKFLKQDDRRQTRLEAAKSALESKQGELAKLELAEKKDVKAIKAVKAEIVKAEEEVTAATAAENAVSKK